MKTIHALLPACMLVCASVPGLSPANALNIDVANHSFEIPETESFGGILPEVPFWIETGDETTQTDPNFGEFTGQLDTGIFLNTPIFDGVNPEPVVNPIANAHGDQLAFLIVNPQSEIEVTLAQQTAAAFEAGPGYQLTVAVGLSWFFTPAAGSTLELALGYFDDQDQFQTVASTLAQRDLFPSQAPAGEQFDLIDFNLLTGELGNDHEALGELISIRIRSASGEGGAWNLDNVRLQMIPEPGTAGLLGIGALALLCRRRG